MINFSRVIRASYLSNEKKKTITRIFLQILMWGSVIIILFPVFWMVSTSLKSVSETFQVPPSLVPRQFTIDAYRDIWVIRPFGRYILNSFIVAFGATLLSLVVSIPAAYSFARYKFKGQNLSVTLLLATQMVPYVMIAIPLFVLFSRIGILNSQVGLILANASISIPFSIFMLRSYFTTLPSELEEAAMIDGCTRFGSLIRIILPLSVPGIFATSVYCFLLVWGEFLFAVILTDTESARTITVGLYTFIGQFMIQWNYLMTAVTIVTIPVVILFIWAQRYLVGGLTSGAIKG